MGFQSSGSAIDNDTIKTNANGAIYADSEVVLGATDQEIAELKIQVIELQAANAITPLDQNTLYADTFTDSDGYVNTRTGGTATFDTDKYKRVNQGGTPARHYKFNETEGSTATDDGSDGSDGTYSGGITVGATGKVNECISIVDADDDFSAPTLGWDEDQSFSIAFWFKKSANPVDDQVFLGNPDATTAADYRVVFQLSSTGVLSFIIDKYGTGGDTLNTTALSNDTWYHIIATFDATSNAMTLYVNNSSADTGTFSNTSCTAMTDVFKFANHVSGREFTGFLDDLRIYETVIPSTLRANLYNSGSGSEADYSTETAQTIICSIPTITGTVTHTQLVVRTPGAETGSSVTYDITDGSTTDTDQATDTKNAWTGSSNPDEITLNLEPKSSSPTTGHPSVETYCLKVWTS